MAFCLVVTVEEIQHGDILSHIVRVGTNVIESVVTRRSADEMGLLHRASPRNWGIIGF